MKPPPNNDPSRPAICNKCKKYTGAFYDGNRWIMNCGYLAKNCEAMTDQPRHVTVEDNIKAAISRVPQAILPRVMKRLEIIPVSCQLRYLLVVLGESTHLQAIKAQCAECLGYKDVGDCTSPTCPLFQYRRK